MNAKRITGQLITTNKEGRDIAGPGRRLVMVYGILAVPDDVLLPDETQYVVYGAQTEDGHEVRLSIVTATAVDRKEDIKGMDASAVLCSPLWRV